MKPLIARNKAQRHWVGKVTQIEDSSSSENEEENENHVSEPISETIKSRSNKDQDEEEMLPYESDEEILEYGSETEETESIIPIINNHKITPSFIQNTIIDNDDEKMESEQESSSDESSSEEEQEEIQMLKPVFIPKSHRNTVVKLTVEEKEYESQKQREIQKVQKKEESLKMVQDEIKKSLVKVQEEVPDIDDTDGINEEEEHLAWVLRELERIKRDKEEQKIRDDEIMDIERRRLMTDEQVEAENSVLKPEKERTKQAFLQKYYHKGAFFADEEILQRDYNEPTIEEKVDMSALPEVMQVKNYGLMSRTKWTHLTNEDTTDHNSSWSKKNIVNLKTKSKMAGMKQDFDKPTKKSRTN